MTNIICLFAVPSHIDGSVPAVWSRMRVRWETGDGRPGVHLVLCCILIRQMYMLYINICAVKTPARRRIEVFSALLYQW